MQTTTTSLKIITAKDSWDSVLDQFEYFDFYHTYEYHEISKAPDEEAFLILYTSESALIAMPFLKRKIFDSGFYDLVSVYGYAGPLSQNIDVQFNVSIFQEALQAFFKTEGIVSVFCRLHPYLPYQENLLENLGDIETLGKVVNIDITKNVDEQRQAFSKTTKRYLNKTRKLCSVITLETETDVKLFKDLYYENMDRVNAKEKYYFNDDYFTSFLGSKSFSTIIYAAVYNETQEIISAAMFVRTKNIVQYHISGTRNDFLDLTPIRLLIDHARLEASKLGCSYFNLGGGLGSAADSLFQFKASFSKDHKDFSVWKFIANQELYDKLVAQFNKSAQNPDFFPLYRI